MSNLRPYLAAYRIALSRELVYRTNFIFGRLREVVVFIALLYLFLAIPNGLAGYTRGELASYLVGGTFLTTVLLAHAMNAMSNEINEGQLTNYLLRPVSYLGFWTAQQLARRTVNAVAGLFQIALLLVLFHGVDFAGPASIGSVALGLLFVFGAMVLVQIIDFLGAVSSFWVLRAYGPRWLIVTLLTFLSGGNVPLDLFPEPFHSIIFATPFPSIIFAPLKVFFGQWTPDQVLAAFLTQWVWIFVLGGVLAIAWQRGVKTYEAYGR